MHVSRFWAIAALPIAVLAAVQITSMVGESPTWDEGIHITAGYRYLATGNYEMNPEHPALGKILCALPLLALRPAFDPTWPADQQVETAAKFIWLNRVSPDRIVNTARSVTILLTILFAVWIAYWTRKHFGGFAALIALTLFCFDPNIIANGRYVTTDLIASLCIFLTATLWIDYLLDPRPVRLAVAGIALGLALSSKYSAIFLVPVLIVIAAFRLRPKRLTLAVLAVNLIALAVIAAVYAPEIAHSRHLPKLYPHLTQKGMAGPALAFAASKLNLPEWTWLLGIDRLSEHDATGHWSYLMGQLSEHGFWNYFPIAMLVKTPVATLLAIAASLVLIWKARANHFVILALAGTAATFFAFCLRSHIDIGVRHVLPVYPFLYVLAGCALARTKWLPVVLMSMLVIESLSIYPDYLAFFNWASGGPANGPRYLLDSNIDWGQDAKKLGRYMADHHIPSVCLFFFGNVDIVRYGVNFTGFAEHPEDNDCVAAVSATPLYGLYVPPEHFAWLRAKQPMARVGYSIYVYDLRKQARRAESK
jgi:hypothetical protein